MHCCLISKMSKETPTSAQQIDRGLSKRHEKMHRFPKELLRRKIMLENAFKDEKFKKGWRHGSVIHKNDYRKISNDCKYSLKGQYVICSKKILNDQSTKRHQWQKSCNFPLVKKRVSTISDTTIKCHATASILVNDFSMISGWFKRHQTHNSSGNTPQLWSFKL